MLWTLGLLASLLVGNSKLCEAKKEVGEIGHGLIGYGITMFQPLCAYSCRVVLSGSPLACSDVSIADEEQVTETSANCFANDEAFLTSMGLCLRSRCTDLPVWEIEKYWQDTVASIRNTHRRVNEPGVNVDANPPAPKWTYQEALGQVSGTPNVTLAYGDALNQTSLVADFQYQLQYNTMQMYEKMEVNHEKYGLIVIALGAVVPIAGSLLRFAPLPKILMSKINAIFIDPPLVGSRHQTPYFNFFIMPTRGQAILIAYIIVINVVFSGIDVQSAQPNAWWWDEKEQEILTSIANRTGVLSFANVPLLILYAGRNNFLYWLTDWTQSTFMVLHRWTAYMCSLQAILHSIIWLRIYVVLEWHDTESKLLYWIWGIIATLAMSIILPASVIPLREKAYEAFLASHIVFSVLALVGSYLHIVYRFQHQWGYEIWMYISFAVWGFDRLARLLRMAKNGLRWANITIIDDIYVQAEIEGAEGHGHAYLYFPTLTWRVWESHPFSILASRVNSSCGSTRQLPDSLEKQDSPNSVEKRTSDGSLPQKLTKPGLAFLIRTFSGATGMLRSHTRLPVLVEADYLPYPDLSRYETVVCVAGGVAITAIAPALRTYPGRAKLFWSSRTAELVKQVNIDHFDANVLIGKRFNLREVLQEEVAKAKGEMAIAVGGPTAMADEVRCLVSELALKSQVPITLIDETYYW